MEQNCDYIFLVSWSITLEMCVSLTINITHSHNTPFYVNTVVKKGKL